MVLHKRSLLACVCSSFLARTRIDKETKHEQKVVHSGLDTNKGKYTLKTAYLYFI